MSGGRRAAVGRDLVGRDLGGYAVRSRLGAGGMGEVYRALDRRLNRDVALKILPEELAADPDRVRRFEKEARAVSALNHPNIVTVYEIGTAGSLSYIAMEFVDGRTLRELLASGSLSVKRLLELCVQISDGLARAHEAGIIHRDLKPENIMVSRDGLAKILDFGLAKRVPLESGGTSGAHGTTLTEEGLIVGTVGYMSPEQASGRTVDFRSDQFAFGSILYEMASGRRAFDRPSKAEALAAIIRDEPDRKPLEDPSLPVPLRWILDRCLAKDPKDRYACTRDLATELRTIRDHGSELPGAPAGKSRRFPRIAAAAILAAAGIAALAFFAGQRSEVRRARDALSPRRTTLTFRRGFLTGARFAPDGQTIVYSAAWDGNPSEIFTTRVGSIESRPLGITEATVLAVSSAGEMAISFGCDARADPCTGLLARAPLAGGTPREILEDVAAADWSPDGKDLAVIHLVNRRYRLEYPIGKVLYESEHGMLSAARVSPGGDLVAFLDHPVRDRGRGILSVVDRTGKKKVLTNEKAKVGRLLWSPTGEEVFFSRWGENQIRGVDLSGRTRSASRILGLDDVSREGHFLDTGALFDNYRRVILARVPDHPVERNLSWLAGSIAADLSNDGQQLLLFEDSVTPDQSVEQTFRTFLRLTDGSDAKPLGEGRALALSPDSGWALVARPPPESRLVLLPTGPGDPKPLPSGPEILRIRRAQFFPDGKRILFVSAHEDGLRSYIQDLEGGPPKPFRDDGSVAFLVSPDGREVAGWSRRDGFMRYPADGRGPPRPIRGALPDDLPLQWGSDGIYVRGPEDHPITLYRLDLGTGRRELWEKLAPPDLTGFRGYAPRRLGVAVTRDGGFYAYTFLTDSSSLILGEAGADWWK